MTKQMADFDVGNPANTSSLTFSLHPGNASQVVGFEVPDRAPGNRAVLTYNLHLRNGEPTFSIQSQSGRQISRWSISSDVRRVFQEILTDDDLHSPTTKVTFVLQAGVGTIDISNAVLWFQRTND